MRKDSKIYVAGHRGMVGSAIVRGLVKEGYNNIVVRTSGETDLRNQDATEKLFQEEQPEYVFMAAAHVGGIKANSTYPADFLFDNIEMTSNIFRNSYKYKVKKLVYLGSACMMPRLADQPMKEESILTGSLEPTNEAYAIAKIAGVKACAYYNHQHGTDYVGVIPANCYGINDEFDSENSHVIPALISRYHNAMIDNQSEVVMWGTGSPIREFLYVDDLADACLFVMNNKVPEIVNIGSGEELSMLQLSKKIAEVVGYKGETTCDTSKPDGMPRRIVDASMLDKCGWKAKTPLSEGLKVTYEWYLKNKK